MNDEKALDRSTPVQVKRQPGTGNYNDEQLDYYADHYAARSSLSPSGEAEATACETCGIQTTFAHDHRADNSGLDDGPSLKEPRKKPVLKSADEMRKIRSKAWATRREKWGKYGHR